VSAATEPVAPVEGGDEPVDAGEGEPNESASDDKKDIPYSHYPNPWANGPSYDPYVPHAPQHQQQENADPWGAAAHASYAPQHQKQESADPWGPAAHASHYKPIHEHIANNPYAPQHYQHEAPKADETKAADEKPTEKDEQTG